MLRFIHTPLEANLIGLQSKDVAEERTLKLKPRSRLYLESQTLKDKMLKN